MAHSWGITGGLWLFEQPWQDGRRTEYLSLDNCRVRHRAHLRGFSFDKRAGDTAALARRVFPGLNSAVGEFEACRSAFGRRRPVIRQVGGFDLFGAHDYLVIVEPLLDLYSVPRRIFAAAVRMDFAPRVKPWLSRLAVQAEQGTYQSA